MYQIDERGIPIGDWPLDKKPDHERYVNFKGLAWIKPFAGFAFRGVEIMPKHDFNLLSYQTIGGVVSSFEGAITMQTTALGATLFMINHEIGDTVSIPVVNIPPINTLDVTATTTDLRRVKPQPPVTANGKVLLQ